MKLFKKIITLNSKKITKSFCSVEPLNKKIKNTNKDYKKPNSVFVIYRDILRKKKDREEELEELNLDNKNLTLKVKPYLMMKMVNAVESKEDFEILLDAFYNFVGYKNNFSQSLKDSIINKGVETNSFEQVLEFYEHSMFLMYFPHFNTTENLVKKLVSENDFLSLFKLSKILKNNCLIKVNQEAFRVLNESVSLIEEGDRENFSENIKSLMEK